MNSALTVSAAPRRSMADVAALAGIEVALVISWSAGFIGIRFTHGIAPIFLILLWRSLISGVVLLPLAVLLGPRMAWRDVVHHALFGAIAMAGYLGAFGFAIAKGVPTGLVALITDMLPLAVAALSWPVLGQALNPRQWLGTLVGLAGVLIATGWLDNWFHTNVLVPAIAQRQEAAPAWAYGLPALGTLLLALGVLFEKRAATGNMPVYQSLCIQCLAAASVFAIFAWKEGSVAPVADWRFAGGILWLAFIATFGAWGLYYVALRKSSPARVTAILYVSPPLTMVWAWAMFGEPLTWSMMAGFVISLAGIILMSHSHDAIQAQPNTPPH